MIEKNKVNVKLSDLQLNKLRIAAKKQPRITLRMNIKMPTGNNLRHELLLTTRLLTKLRNVLYVLVMSRLRFRINPHSIVA